MNESPAGWHPDPHHPGQERYWDGAQWTEQRRPGSGQAAPPPPPAAAEPRRKRRGGTVLKVALGVVLGGTLLIVGCAALIGGAANEAVKSLDAEQRAHAISPATFQSMKIGWSEARVIKHAGKEPEDRQEFENKDFLNDEPSKSSCIYFNKAGGEFGDVYQLCFDNGKLESKNAY